MTGPEHYREAEKLLGQLANIEHGAPSELGVIAEAQAHATLALAAATALNIRKNGALSVEHADPTSDWQRAVSS